MENNDFVEEILQQVQALNTENEGLKSLQAQHLAKIGQLESALHSVQAQLAESTKQVASLETQLASREVAIKVPSLQSVMQQLPDDEYVEPEEVKMQRDKSIAFVQKFGEMTAKSNKMKEIIIRFTPA